MEKIRMTLKELGIYPNLKGYHYLVYAINAVRMKMREFIYDTSYIEMYQRIAKTYQDTPVRVERAIRFAVERAYAANRQKFTEFFGDIDHKPTNSEFIAVLAEYARGEYYVE